MSKTSEKFDSRGTNKRKNKGATPPQKRQKNKYVYNRKKYGKILPYARRMAADNGNIPIDHNLQEIQKIKQLYELARNVSNCPDVKETTNQLFILVKKHFKELLFKHDGSRIVQFCLSVGTEEHREYIYTELIPYFTKLVSEKYGRNILIKLLKIVPKSRAIMRTTFSQHDSYINWLTHKEAHRVLNTIFSEYSNATEKKEMLDSIYDKSTKILLKDIESIETPQSIQIDQKNQELLAQKLILKKHKYLVRFIESCSKKELLGDYHLAHALLLRLINSLYEQPLTNDQILMALESTKKYLIPMALTKEGSQCFRLITSIMSVKARKALILECKQSLEMLLNNENGHLALISLISLVDDTSTLNKHIISKIVSIPLTEMSKHGKKVLLFILSNTPNQESNPNAFSTKYFVPEINIQLESSLKKSQELGYSKKPLQHRMQELAGKTTLSSILDHLQPIGDKTQDIANILSDIDMTLNVSIIIEWISTCRYHHEEDFKNRLFNTKLSNWIEKYQDFLTTPFFQTLILKLLNLDSDNETDFKSLINLFDASIIEQSKTNDVFYRKLAKFL